MGFKMLGANFDHLQRKWDRQKLGLPGQWSKSKRMHPNVMVKSNTELHSVNEAQETECNSVLRLPRPHYTALAGVESPG